MSIKQCIESFSTDNRTNLFSIVKKKCRCDHNVHSQYSPGNSSEQEHKHLLSSKVPPLWHNIPSHGPMVGVGVGGGAVGMTLLKVAITTFETGLVRPASSDACRAKAYENVVTAVTSGTVMTYSSRDPKGFGLDIFPSRIWLNSSWVAFEKLARSSAGEWDILMS